MGRGKSNTAYYRIVVIKRNLRYRGRYTGLIGFYSPASGKSFIYINGHVLGYWLNRGARLNKSVTKILVKMVPNFCNIVKSNVLF